MPWGERFDGLDDDDDDDDDEEEEEEEDDADADDDDVDDDDKWELAFLGSPRKFYKSYRWDLFLRGTYLSRPATQEIRCGFPQKKILQNNNIHLQMK